MDGGTGTARAVRAGLPEVGIGIPHGWRDGSRLVMISKRDADHDAVLTVGRAELGRAGSGRAGSGRAGSGRAGSGRDGTDERSALAAHVRQLDRSLRRFALLGAGPATIGPYRGIHLDYTFAVDTRAHRARELYTTVDGTRYRFHLTDAAPDAAHGARLWEQLVAGTRLLPVLRIPGAPARRRTGAGLSDIVVELPDGWEDRSELSVISTTGSRFLANIVVNKDGAGRYSSFAAFHSASQETITKTFSGSLRMRTEMLFDGPVSFGPYDGHLLDYTMSDPRAAYRQRRFSTVANGAYYLFTYSNTVEEFAQGSAILEWLVGGARIGAAPRAAANPPRSAAVRWRTAGWETPDDDPA